MDIWQRADTALYIRIYNRLVDGTGSQKWGDPFPLDMDGAAMNTTPVAATTVKTNDTFVSYHLDIVGRLRSPSGRKCGFITLLEIPKCSLRSSFAAT